MWPHDIETGQAVGVDKSADPHTWYEYADSNIPIVTQWDDGDHVGTEPGKVFTSSASMPSLVFSMLADLDVEAGNRVLEIGTGTAYNAALLAHRLGASNVVTVEVDEGVAAAARESLRRFGLNVEVITGDGFLGHPDGGPYARIIATCGLREIPFAWVEQTNPDGVILAPWGTNYSFYEATARLVVAKDGRSATGPFTRAVTFMPMRSQRLAWPRHAGHVPPEGTAGADKSSTTITNEQFSQGRFAVAEFATGLRLRDCAHNPSEKRDGVRPVWFYGLTDRSWAVVVFRDDRPESEVYQSGPRRLWDETEAAYRWWEDKGKPGYERFGLTVDAGGQHAWLDDPGESWPV